MNKEAQTSQSAYRGAKSFVASEVKQVVTHRCSMVFLPYCCTGRYLFLRYLNTSSGLRWSRGNSNTSDVVGAMKGDSCHGRVSGGDS